MDTVIIFVKGGMREIVMYCGKDAKQAKRLFRKEYGTPKILNISTK